MIIKNAVRISQNNKVHQHVTGLVMFPKNADIQVT